MISTLFGVIVYLITFLPEVWIIQKTGLVVELLIFTFGISYRYLLIEKEKQATQKKLIVQLNENAELQEKVNRELIG